MIRIGKVVYGYVSSIGGESFGSGGRKAMTVAVAAFALILLSGSALAEDNDACSSAYHLPRQIESFIPDKLSGYGSNLKVREGNLRRRCEEIEFSAANKRNEPILKNCDLKVLNKARQACDKAFGMVRR